MCYLNSKATEIHISKYWIYYDYIQDALDNCHEFFDRDNLIIFRVTKNMIGKQIKTKNIKYYTKKDLEIYKCLT